MEPQGQKSLERVVSQRALQIGSSFSCQICVVGFLCGVCLTSLLLAALTSMGSFEFGGISISSLSAGISPRDSSSGLISMVTNGDCKPQPGSRNGRMDSWGSNNKHIVDGQVSLLYSAWSASLGDSDKEENKFLRQVRPSRASVPKAPHLEDCKLSRQVNERYDNHGENKSLPPWTLWKGLLNSHAASSTSEQLRYLRQRISEGAHTPWVAGSEDENYPLTRKVQSDIWTHQHPIHCSDPNVKFLIADWEKLPGFGIGAQITGMCGLLAIAINEKRVLVTNYYNRADHKGCKGESRSRWSCYFFPETSQECRDRAFELMNSKEAWDSGTITKKENYSSKVIWAGKIPRVWGNPWNYLQPTTEINGTLVVNHRKMDRRWWRAQAARYLMRFQTEYTCRLMNAARHAAFGWEAAQMVLANGNIQEGDVTNNPSPGIADMVWSNHKPWIPWPLLSMHVRMGDKACEMKISQFDEYMHLANRIRKYFPQLHSIWLSTEMQEVVDKTKSNPHWNFYYTNVTRQVGNMSMASYEASLGRETSTNYPLVNLLMASDADFFVGALGSTWCFLIDGMRNTGGKAMAGYLSVNKDRFW